ncbi:MAG: hypothetical protein R2748_27515 [Bryobacterales bacterium]
MFGVSVVVDELAAYGLGAARDAEVERPAHDVELVDALVAELAVAVVPLPVPLVVQAQLRERAVGRGAFPEVVMDALGHGAFSCLPIEVRHL